MAKKTQASSKSSRGGGGGNSNTTKKKSSTPKFVHCPYTNQKVFIQRATIKDLKCKSTYASSNKKRLWLLTSPAQRTEITTKAAQAIASVEQALLPSLGGRSWEVTCKLSDHSSILFRTWKGRMELATLPHLIDKIPQPPVWPGRRRNNPEEYLDNDINDDDSDENYCRGLQEREISTLSQVAYDIKSQGYPTPTITLKWKSPDYQTFTSRKSAWEYATQMAKNEVLIHKHILGIGSSGKLLQPAVCSAPMALKVGKLRFDRDGLWLVGQELSWQEDRPELLQEQAEEEALAKAERAGSDDDENDNEKKPRPLTGLSLYLTSNREEYRKNNIDNCSTLNQATRELRQVWKNLSEDERNVWNIKANPDFVIVKKEKDDDENEEDVVMMSNNNTDDGEPPSNNKNDGDDEKKLPAAATKRSSSESGNVVPLLLPPPKKRRISPSTFYIKSRRKVYHADRCLERGSRYTLGEADTELREIWKTLSKQEQLEWKTKLDQYEIDLAKQQQQQQQQQQQAEVEAEEAMDITASAAGSKVEQVEQALPLLPSSSSTPLLTTTTTATANTVLEASSVAAAGAVHSTGGAAMSSIPTTSEDNYNPHKGQESESQQTSTLIFEEEKKEDESSSSSRNVGSKGEMSSDGDNKKVATDSTTTAMVVEENKKETTKTTASETSSKPILDVSVPSQTVGIIGSQSNTPQQGEDDETKIEVSRLSANATEGSGTTTAARATPSPETADTMMMECNEVNNSKASQPISMPAAAKKEEAGDVPEQKGKETVLGGDHKEPHPVSSNNSAKVLASAVAAAPVSSLSSAKKKKKKSMANKKSPPSTASKSSRIKQPTAQATKRWCLNKDQIDLCYEACMEHYEQVMRTVKARDLHRELQDGFDVLRERGRGRYDMELPAFDNSKVFHFLTDLQKAPWMPVVRAILGDDVVLIHKGCFLSMPGAETQEYHQDGIHLTTQTQRPCHAINVFVPLVDLTTRNGPTEFTLGSHVLGHEDYDKDFVEIPKPKAGTPVIFDYRLGHRGMGNSSQSCRPIVYCSYARGDSESKTFRDSINFSRKRYHKIGELIEKPLSREERRNNRKRSIEQREEEAELKRVLEEQEEEEAEKQNGGGDAPLSLDGGPGDSTPEEANSDNGTRSPSGGASAEDQSAEQKQQQQRQEHDNATEPSAAEVAAMASRAEEIARVNASANSFMMEGHVTYRSGPM